MATTTNYGWTTPDDTALVKDGAAAIRSLGTSVDTTTKALNPSTTLGDIEYRSSTANTNTRLGIGSNGNVLTVAGGVPSWAAPTSTTAPFVGCALSSSVDLNINNNTTTAITWNTEDFDTDGFHSTSTNTSRFTIPAGKAGKYLFQSTIRLNNNTTGNRTLSLSKNGTNIKSVFMIPDNTNPSISVSAVVSLAEADYVEATYLQDSGSTVPIYLTTNQGYQSLTYLGA